MTAIDLTDVQLRLLQGLKAKGWPAELTHILLARCGSDQCEWDALERAGLVEIRDKGYGRWHLSAAGKREYNRQRKGRWF